MDVRIHTGELTDDLLKAQDVVVVTQDFPQSELIRMNQLVRGNNGKFILAVTRGVTAHVFSDFGPEHNIFDRDGALPINLVVEHIHFGNPGVVTVDARFHGLQEGDCVQLENVVTTGQTPVPAAAAGVERKKFTEIIPLDGKVEHPDQINSCFIVRPHVVNGVTDNRKFQIADLSALADCEYSSGGDIAQRKLEVQEEYEDLEQQLKHPRMEPHYEDFSKFGRMETLHTGFRALLLFQEKHEGRLPELHSRKDANEVLQLAQDLDKDIDPDMIRNMALYARTELTALCALFGGIVAQEIVKFTGKFSPIKQWIHFDAFELLHSEPPVDGTPVGDRYDHQISVFGKAFQAKAGRQKLFMVGCGALGCEYLKAIAMIGLGVHGGEIHITDMDTIELSNLSRQFLFRRKHINQAKSVSAAQAVQSMNPAIVGPLKVHEIKVAPETEDVFDDDFWSGLDFVVNALDNNVARVYVDGQCVNHGLPLFESGTLGTSANNAIILPHQTRSYGEGAIAGEGQGIAQCTLQNFPSLPLHCIEFAREKFDETFSSGAQKLADYLENPAGFIERNAQEPIAELDGLQTVKQWLEILEQVNLDTVVRLAVQEFTEMFRDKIRDLQDRMPRDARQVDKETGADLGPFWRGHKRFPQYAEFDPENPEHLDFVFHTVFIFSHIFRLPAPTREEVQAAARKVEVPAWVPSGKEINLDEDEDEKKDSSSAAADDGDDGKMDLDEDEEAEIQALKQELLHRDLEALKSSGKTKILPADFEKDDDSNHHIDWITSCTNLRSWNYYIKPSSKAQCRMTAGRIIPAIATTTASITGFNQIEIYKYLLGRPLDSYRQTTLDLGTNTFVVELLGDPNFNRSDTEISGVRCVPEKFTVWDSIRVDRGNLTVQEFVDYFNGEFSASLGGSKIELDSIFPQNEGTWLYQSTNPHAGPARMAKMLLRRPNLGEKTRAQQQEILDRFQEWERVSGDHSESLVARYIRLSGGKPLPPKRNYLWLTAKGSDEDGNDVNFAKIKYVFA